MGKGALLPVKLDSQLIDSMVFSVFVKKAKRMNKPKPESIRKMVEMQTRKKIPRTGWVRGKYNKGGAHRNKIYQLISLETED